MSGFQPPRVRSLTQTCLACPSQWEGELEDGRALYIRLRHDSLTVGSGRTLDEAIENRDDIYSEILGNGDLGVISFSDLSQTLDGILDFSGAEVSEMRFEEWD